MAVFTKHDKPSNGNTGATIIATGTKINGEVEIECSLHIDGEFEGVIHSKNIITIGKSGIVSGEIYASKLIVSGKFTGMTECETVEIMPQGRVDGKIISKELVIERKGFFIGESKIKDEKTALEKSKVDPKQPSPTPTAK